MEKQTHQHICGKTNILTEFFSEPDVPDREFMILAWVS